MTSVRPQWSWVLAAVNLVAMVVLLAAKPPEYERLRLVDEERAAGSHWMSTADPMYLAARPFYSSAHVMNVSPVEDLYFMLNTPAMLAALSVSTVVGMTTFEWWTGSYRVSSEWDSWVLAIVFAGFAVAWAFMVGMAIEWWQRRDSAA